MSVLCIISLSHVFAVDGFHRPIRCLISDDKNTQHVFNGKNTHSHYRLFKQFNQIIAALAVSLGPLAGGLGKGYSSPAIASLQELKITTHGNYTSFTISDQEASWIASLSLLGKCNKSRSFQIK